MSTVAEKERQLNFHRVAAALTLLVRSVLHVVSSISEIRDQRVRAASRRVADQSFDVFPSSLGESASIHCEVCGSISEDS